jgi:hypothetical protein
VTAVNGGRGVSVVVGDRTLRLRLLRPGPGIVLASVALDAHIVSETFFGSLVLLAVLTSLLAGMWLERVVRRGLPLRHDDVASGPTRRVLSLDEGVREGRPWRDISMTP